MRILYAVTGHGFGHATRAAEILRAWVDLCPTLEPHVASTAPPRLFRTEAGAQLPQHARAYEPGTLQRSCFEVDVEGTRAAYRAHLAERPDRVTGEARFLQSLSIEGVVADVPALALEAAEGLGLPTAAVWNFTWDWILEPILDPHADDDFQVEGGAEGRPLPQDDDLRALPGRLRAVYARAGLHLKLPFSPLQPLFERVEEAPLVGRRSRADRAATLRAVGLDPTDRRPVVLVGMGGWECASWSPIPLRGCGDLRFLVVGDVPLLTEACVASVPATLVPGVAFSDLVAAADLVLSKPGYGVASECALHGRPLLGVERRGFREAPELSRDLAAMIPLGELSLRDFFAGSWERGLVSLLEAPSPRATPLPHDGARVVVARLARHFGIPTR